MKIRRGDSDERVDEATVDRCLIEDVGWLGVAAAGVNLIGAVGRHLTLMTTPSTDDYSRFGLMEQ